MEYHSPSAVSALWNPGLVCGEGVLTQCFYARLHSKRGWAEIPLNLPKYVLCRPTKTAEAAFQMSPLRS